MRSTVSTSPRLPSPFETYLTTRSPSQLHSLLEWAADATCGRGSKRLAPWGYQDASSAHDLIAKRIADVQGGVVREPDRRDLIAEIDALKKRVAELEARVTR